MPNLANVHSDLPSDATRGSLANHGSANQTKQDFGDSSPASRMLSRRMPGQFKVLGGGLCHRDSFGQSPHNLNTSDMPLDC